MIGSGWHSGINSDVFFAAIIPAIRAAAKASPFFRFPLSNAAIELLLSWTDPTALAVLIVSDLSDTSTMCTWPSPSRCVSSLIYNLLVSACWANRRFVAPATSAFRIKLSPTRNAFAPYDDNSVRSLGP